MGCLVSSRKILWYGLGAFWLLDALLQMQPHMFTSDLVTSVMMPNAFNQPAWVTNSIDWMLNLVLAHNLVIFNWFIAGIQAIIGLLIVTGKDRTSGTIGLWLSLIWGAAVWYFGEGFGAILTGSATYLTGGPGSVVLYMIIAVILLRSHGSNQPVNPSLRYSLTVLWTLGALMQMSPAFWTRRGLWVQFYSSAVMTRKYWVTLPIYGMAHATLFHAVLWNLLFIAMMLFEAFGVWFRWGPWFYVWSAVWLVFIFWLGENFGMILSGITTDLNTAPLWALMMWPLYLERRHRIAKASLRTSLPTHP